VRWTYSWYASPSGLGEPPHKYGMGVRTLSGRTERSDPRPHMYSPTSVGSKSCRQWFRVSQMILREQISMGLSAGWAISHTKWAVFLDKKAGGNGLSKIFDVKLKVTYHASPGSLRPVRRCWSHRLGLLGPGGMGIGRLAEQVGHHSKTTESTLPTGQNHQTNWPSPSPPYGAPSRAPSPLWRPSRPPSPLPRRQLAKATKTTKSTSPTGQN
jgi:hypothetical protein